MVDGCCFNCMENAYSWGTNSRGVNIYGSNDDTSSITTNYVGKGNKVFDIILHYQEKS